MLRRALAALVVVLAGAAWAQDDEKDDGLKHPEALTIGVSDQFLGQLAPDGRTVYFVSNRNTTSEIYAQDLEEARPKLLFDEGADVTWPRVSPDGKRLLYISFRDDAAGQLCVRELPDRRRRCLAEGVGAVQAQWMGNARIVLVSRGAIEGDLRVHEVSVGRRLLARPLVERNLTSPAVSPDGRWLVYVPVERYVAPIGPGFAAKAAPRLEALRLDRPGHPVPLALDVPGLTGQPAFSLDGKFLYFSQFFNDSNRDGEIDATDHGVLFRVAFETGAEDAPARASRAFPEQLTDATWNCQYPSPARTRLIATCAKGGGLDVFGLPLEGMVPDSWDAARLRLEIEMATRRHDELLLYRHLLEREQARSERRELMMWLAMLHLEFDEFDAAEFYARHIAAERDRATRGVSSALAAQIAHRRALRGRERGHVNIAFAADARARLEQLHPSGAGSPAGVAMKRIVRSEIADTLGDKALARRELEAVSLEGVTPETVLEAYYDRADALYRQLDDREALEAAATRLAAHPALSPDRRLTYARAAVRAIVRGRPAAEAHAALAHARASAAPGSELAFAAELAEAVSAIRGARPPQAVEDNLVALYKRQRERHRKRALLLDAVTRADEEGADRTIDALADLYVDDVKPGTEERKRAERLFRRVVLGRAYRHLEHKRDVKARADFAAVAKETGALEAHINYLELRLKEGVSPAALQAEYDRRDADYSRPVAQFVRAYLQYLALPALDDEAHEKAAARILSTLRAEWDDLKGKREVRALMGATLHDRYLRTGDLTTAQRANTQYLVALELAGNNPRYQAMALGQLGLLHAQVGNYRIALGYLEDREKLPFDDDASGLAQRLAMARTLLHVDREADAADAAERALAACEATPALREHLPLVLDRAALYNLAADRYARAVELYDRALPLLQAASGPAADRNRMTARLGRAGAALGAGQLRRALEDLVFVEGRLDDPALARTLAWPRTPRPEVLRAYRAIAAGLRAQAHRALGELPEAARALELRRRVVKAQFRRSGLDEHLRALALVEAQLADLARERKDPPRAVTWLRRALLHADEYVKRTKVPLESEQLDLLWMAAELRLETGVKLRFNLPRRLREAHDKMMSLGDPAWRSWARLFEIYIGLTAPAHGRGHAGLEEEPDTRPPTEDAARRLRLGLSWPR